MATNKKTKKYKKFLSALVVTLMIMGLNPEISYALTAFEEAEFLNVMIPGFSHCFNINHKAGAGFPPPPADKVTSSEYDNIMTSCLDDYLRPSPSPNISTFYHLLVPFSLTSLELDSNGRVRGVYEHIKKTYFDAPDDTPDDTPPPGDIGGGSIRPGIPGNCSPSNQFIYRATVSWVSAGVGTNLPIAKPNIDSNPGPAVAVNEIGPLLYLSQNSRELLQQICELQRSIDISTRSIDASTRSIDDSTKSIDTTTKAIKEDTGQIKIDVGIIKTIQERFEEKTFITDPAIRAEARANLKAAEEEVWKAVMKGRISNNFKEGKSYVPSPKEYIAEETFREAAIFLYSIEQLAEGNWPGLGEKGKQAAGTILEMMKNSVKNNGLSNADSVKLRALFETADLDLDESSLNALERMTYNTQPENNIYGLYGLVTEEYNRRVRIAEQNAREQLIAGGGFVPEIKCSEGTGGIIDTPLGKVCGVVQTVVPAQIIKDILSSLTTAEIEQAILAGGFGGQKDADAVKETIKKIKEDREGPETPGTTEDEEES